MSDDEEYDYDYGSGNTDLSPPPSKFASEIDNNALHYIMILHLYNYIIYLNVIYR